MFFDTHAHINDERFDEDRDLVISRARESGIEYILNPGADLKTSIAAVNIANQNEKIYAAVGVHPHDVKDINEETIQELKKLSENKKVVAIGEIGLDYYYDNSPRDEQRKWFKRQIELAKEVNLPIIIHDRDAHKETFDILKEYDVGSTGCVMHCYASSVEMAKEYIKMGIYISIAGPVTFKNAKKTYEVAKEIPLEYLLVETDSPYLTPTPYRGKRNESAYVKLVAQKIAEAKGITLEELAHQTTLNAKKIFNIND